MADQIGINYDDHYGAALREKARVLGMQLKEVAQAALVEQGEYEYQKAVETINKFEELLEKGKSGVMTLKNPSKVELKQIRSLITMMKKQKKANEALHQIYETEGFAEVEYVEA